MDMNDAVTTQEERIAAQRARVQQRMAGREEVEQTITGASPVQPTRSAAEQKATSTRYEMAALRYGGMTAVTGLSAAAESDENTRRQHVTEDRARLTELRQQDSLDAQQVALNLQFESLYHIGVPHQLHKALQQQQQECTSMVGVKDKVIAELRAQLHQRETEYVELLQKNKTTVQSLVESMRSGTEDYLSQYTAKQAELEASYEAERQAYMAKGAEELNTLVQSRRTKETEYRKRRERKTAEAQEQLEDRYETGYEDFNEAKRGHQQDVHTIQTELEKSKADYLLNGERLAYNLQVLRERVKENRSAQAQYRKRMAKLQETLATLLARYQDGEKRYQRANTELTTQLHRADQQYGETQTKFADFEKKDKKKYRQLWKMHHDKCQALAQSCLQADRVVYGGLLYMPWQPPALQYWPVEEQEVTTAQEESLDAMVQNTTDVDLSEAAQMLFSILKSQAAFLVNEDVQAAIQKVEGTSEGQADVEGILTTLRLHRTSDVEDLLEYFIVENDDETVALINPQEALKALNTFLLDRQAAEAQAKTMAESSDTAAQSTSASMITKKTSAAARLRAAEKEYWRNMAETVPKEHLDVWAMLEDGLSQYLAQLQQRKQLISETDTLRAQNDELRDLIQQYASSDINYELYVPPRLFSQTMTAPSPSASLS